jgi:hypothetical protein
MLGMEGSVLYAVLALLNSEGAGGTLSIPGLLALYPVALAVNKAIHVLRWHIAIFRSISWFVWLCAVLLTVKIQLYGGIALADTDWLLAVPRALMQLLDGFRPELAILISSAIIWWLGRRASGIRLTFNVMVSEFQFGIFALMLTFFVAAQLEAGIGGAVLTTLIFFLFALPGVSIARSLEGGGWMSGLNQGNWAGLLALSVGLVVMGGLLITAVVTPELLRLVWSGVEWFWGVVLNVIIYLASLLPSSGAPETMPAVPPPVGDLDPEEIPKIFHIPDALRSGMRIGWTVLVAGCLLIALWRVSSDIMGWLRRRLAGMAGAEYEPVRGAFRADLLRLFRGIAARLLGWTRIFQRRHREVVHPELESVRSVYRQMLKWAKKAGYGRLPSETPLEYCRQLVEALPQGQEQIELITSSYTVARYGSRLITDSELDTTRRGWHQLKQKHLRERRPDL